MNEYTTSSLGGSKDQQNTILFTNKVDNKPQWVF